MNTNLSFYISLTWFVKVIKCELSYQTQWNEHADVPCYDSVGICLESLVKW